MGEMMKNIVIIGFMGNGKSSVGRVLAARLGRTFYDIAKEIERREEMSVMEVFAWFGEEYFRAREKEIVQELSQKSGLVISTGGGTVADPENLQLLQENGVLICLSASEDTILERVNRHGTRPLLANMSQEEQRQKIKDLLAARKKMYRKAVYMLDTSSRGPREVAEDIKKFLRRRGL